MVRHCFSHIRIYEQKPSCVALLTQILPKTHTHMHTHSHSHSQRADVSHHAAEIGNGWNGFLSHSLSCSLFSLIFLCFSFSLCGWTLVTEPQKSAPWSKEQLPNYYLNVGHTDQGPRATTWASLMQVCNRAHVYLWFISRTYFWCHIALRIVVDPLGGVRCSHALRTEWDSAVEFY